jgi:hypothetical protein
MLPGTSLHLQDFTNHLLILLLVALLETHLGVSNDAAGVQNERRSAKGVLLAQVGFMALKHGEGDLQFAVETLCRLRVRMHVDHEYQQPLLAETLMEFLEMNYLLQ